MINVPISSSLLPFIHGSGVLPAWIARKALDAPKATVRESSLARFRSGLLTSALTQPLISFTIPTSIKSYWASIRQQKLPIPTCHHHNATCPCGAPFTPSTGTWPCGHSKIVGEVVAYNDALLFDINSPPSVITTYLRICKSCGALARCTSLNTGLFNFDERHLLTVPFLLSIRNSLSFGTPLHNIITSWALSLNATFDHHISPTTISKIKAAFLAFEAMSDHGEHSTCYLCKEDPSHLIFDGNAKLVFKIPGMCMLTLLSIVDRKLMIISSIIVQLHQRPNLCSMLERLLTRRTQTSSCAMSVPPCSQNVLVRLHHDFP